MVVLIRHSSLIAVAIVIVCIADVFHKKAVIKYRIG